MRRLFWVGVGAAGAVVLARRVERATRRYTPAGLAEQVEAAGERTTSALREAVESFRSSRAERELDLTTTLLVTPEEGDAGAVFGRGRARRGDDGSAWADSRPSGGPARGGPTARTDPDEPLYEF